MLVESMNAMNEHGQPGLCSQRYKKGRRGCSSPYGKMLFSAGNSQLAILAYIPVAYENHIDGKDWLEHVIKPLGGKFLKQQGNLYMGKVDTNFDEGVCLEELQERGIVDSFSYLEAKGLYSDADYDVYYRSLHPGSSDSEASSSTSESEFSYVSEGDAENEGRLLSPGGFACEVCRHGISIRCIGPCQLRIFWFTGIKCHYDHCQSCYTAAQALDINARRALHYRLAVRNEPSLRGSDMMWNPITDLCDIHVPMDLETPAGPAVMAARAGSLASIWIPQPRVDEDSEASRPPSPNSVPAPVHSAAAPSPPRVARQPHLPSAVGRD